MSSKNTANWTNKLYENVKLLLLLCIGFMVQAISKAASKLVINPVSKAGETSNS